MNYVGLDLKWSELTNGRVGGPPSIFFVFLSWENDMKWHTSLDYGVFQNKIDDSTPSKRITRGTPSHVQVVDNPPSVSIGLTQDF
ncbi:hypothetical protein H5410_043620 [Solanum commersonii]|uniref:Uncharacterized protein n=1 Tax=Solanum commersonii TaxID=4109 RepID=A0A9J5XZD2_SOLCO|nr:hypothetical protein H5410_043620 [Solanum commersonii]